MQDHFFFRSLHSSAKLGGALLTPSPAKFAAQPDLGLEHRRAVKPCGEGIIRSELPGFAREDGKDVLRHLFGAGMIVKFAQGCSVDQVQMTPDYGCESSLCAISDKIPQQFKVG